jgi:DNA topoisomerase-1
MILVLVESPTKAKTISRFLEKDSNLFRVESTYGHVRDLPKGELGVEVEKGFRPRYIIPKKSQKTVNFLKKLSRKAEKVILATDEDREGEAIAWHLLRALDLDNPKSEFKKLPKTARIVFHEITQNAIKEALKKPKAVNMHLVDAQQARRILDRLVGYKLSPFLWKKLIKGLSAGRVQSVALRLIVEREKEIRNFKPKDYWTITAWLKDESKNEIFDAVLTKIDNKDIPKPGILREKEVEKIKSELTKTSKWKIKSVEKRAKEQKPPPPFTTSTLQQAAWQKFKFSAKKTMFIAQQLYEGIEIKKERGAVGLITYMRTDSLNISENALKTAASYLKTSFGSKYALNNPRRFKTKNKLAQEAHEAIRPTDPWRTPESIKDDLSSDQCKLYQLIWKRFLAGQMPNALFEETKITTEARSGPAKSYLFQSAGAVLKFDGFLKIYPVKKETKLLPLVDKNDKITPAKILAQKHQTKPPARYTEASLVKTLEKNGVGRPSTYAPILSIIQERNYVQKNQSKCFVPTEIGEKVNEILTKHFPKITDIGFTAKMEKQLDMIAKGKTNKKIVLEKFYAPFKKNLDEKYQAVKKQDLTEKTDELCEKCQKPMLIKHGRFGKFMACSGFPECRNTKSLPPKTLETSCPFCKKGKIVERRTKKGKLFYGCSTWPTCKFATWQEPTGKLCPLCQNPLVRLKDKIKCSAKTCDYCHELGRV